MPAPKKPYKASLTLVTSKTQKFWTAEVKDGVLVESTWTGTKAPKESTSPVKYSGEEEFEKAVFKKLAAGWIHLRDSATAAPGDLLLDVRAPNPYYGTVTSFDLSPDGTTLAIATRGKDKSVTQVHTIDVATGHERLIFEVPSTEVSKLLFDASSSDHGISLVYTAENAVWRLSPKGPNGSFSSKRLAPFGRRSSIDAIQGAWDGARARLMLFGSEHGTKVIDARGTLLLEVPPTPNETRFGAISRSGKLLALSRRASESNDPTSVEIWDIDTRALIRTLSVSDDFESEVGFDPSEERLFLMPGLEISIADGALLWQGDLEEWKYSWSYSPDGTKLVIGDRNHVYVLDARSHERTAWQPEYLWRGRGRVYRVVISDDNSKVAISGGARLRVHKM